MENSVRIQTLMAVWERELRSGSSMRLHDATTVPDLCLWLRTVHQGINRQILQQVRIVEFVLLHVFSSNAQAGWRIRGFVDQLDSYLHEPKLHCFEMFQYFQSTYFQQSGSFQFFWITIVFSFLICKFIGATKWILLWVFGLNLKMLFRWIPSCCSKQVSWFIVYDFYFII
jgi:hypothetical protein